MTEETYEPFTQWWEKEISRIGKKDLIELLRRALIKVRKAEEFFDEIIKVKDLIIDEQSKNICIQILAKTGKEKCI